MTRILLMILCLLLTGCTAETGEDHQTVPIAAVTVGAGEDRGSVRVFPVQGERITGLRSFGDGLLVFSGEEETSLTLLRGTDLESVASVQLDITLDPWDPTLSFGNTGISFYHRQTRQTILLDDSLYPCAAIPAPEKLTGEPILDPEGRSLHYISGSTLRVWDLTSGRDRCIKDFSGQHPRLTGLHLEGTVLECWLGEKTMFLDGTDGRLLRETGEGISLRSRGGAYSCVFPAGMGQNLIYGRAGEEPWLLLPAGSSQNCFFLEDGSGAVTVTNDDSGVVTLDYYVLDGGTGRASLSLASNQVLLTLGNAGDGGLYLLMDDPSGQSLWRWDPGAAPFQDRKGYSFPCDQDGEPDPQGLEACQALAAAIGEKYGLRVKLWKEAAEKEPWDYQLEPEYQTAVLYQELKKLDTLLDQYPRKLLEETASHFGSLNLCLVRQITGSPESGSLNRATGVQFLSDTDAHVALAVGPYLEQALYHELFHVMETHILTSSTAFDRWDSLNPAGFQYDYDYLSNASRDSGVYLRQEYRAFVDTFSMSYPKEDRARIMEYAMLPGNETLFQPEKMQRKLQALCKGIRDAFGLEEHPGIYLWEQYLED